VSRFRRERLYASIEADRAVLVHVDGRRAVQAEALVPMNLDAEPERSFSTLGGILSASPWQGIDRHVVLSDRLVRYLVVERPEGVRSAAELRLACEARFQSCFDLAAEAWELMIDLQPSRAHCLICGIPRRLLDGVRSAFESNGRLLSMRPYLVSELRRCGPALPRACWFATCARDSVAIAAITHSGCQSVRVAACSRPTAPAVEELLAREKLLIGGPDAEAPTLATGIIEGEAEQGTLRRLDQRQWGSLPAARSADYRLALSELWA